MSWIDAVVDQDDPGAAPNGTRPARSSRSSHGPLLLHRHSRNLRRRTRKPAQPPCSAADQQALIAENSEDVMIYGDGGAGKTTIALDLAVHWAAGADWLGIPVPGRVSCLVVENEGPRPMLRAKVARKLPGAHTPPGGRAHIIDEPLHRRSPSPKKTTAASSPTSSAPTRLDAVIVGPLVVAGMEAHGTLGEVREFLQLLADVRRRAARRICFVLIHHANRAGQVSGAWEGAVDTMLHCTSMGTGRTRLHVQKARWASQYHAHTLNLAWDGHDGYTVEDKPELSDEDLAEQMLAAVAENPGTGWTRVEQAIPGVRSTRRRDVRDRLLHTGRLVNIGTRDGVDTWLTTCLEPGRSRVCIWPPTPPSRHLRPDPEADGTQAASASGATGRSQLRPASRLKRDAVGTQQLHPPGKSAAGRRPDKPHRGDPVDPHRHPSHPLGVGERGGRADDSDVRPVRAVRRGGRPMTEPPPSDPLEVAARALADARAALNRATDALIEARIHARDNQPRKDTA